MGCSTVPWTLTLGFQSKKKRLLCQKDWWAFIQAAGKTLVPCHSFRLHYWIFIYKNACEYKIWPSSPGSEWNTGRRQTPVSHTEAAGTAAGAPELHSPEGHKVPKQREGEKTIRLGAEGKHILKNAHQTASRPLAPHFIPQRPCPSPPPGPLRVEMSGWGLTQLIQLAAGFLSVV